MQPRNTDNLLYVVLNRYHFRISHWIIKVPHFISYLWFNTLLFKGVSLKYLSISFVWNLNVLQLRWTSSVFLSPVTPPPLPPPLRPEDSKAQCALFVTQPAICCLALEPLYPPRTRESCDMKSGAERRTALLTNGTKQSQGRTPHSVYSGYKPAVTALHSGVQYRVHCSFDLKK